MDTRFNGKTAILYARASTLEQSTIIQLKQLEEFCNQNNIIIKQEFEENVSGAKECREQLQTILQNEPFADMLIVREISRLSREEDYVAALEKIRNLALKYDIYILLDNYYIEKGKRIELSDGITMLVKLYGAADERLKIKDRTVTARAKYRENPINAVNSTTHFGFKKVNNPNFVKGVNTKRILVPDEEQWKIVEKIFDLRIKGFSNDIIASTVGMKKSTVQKFYSRAIIRHYMDKTKLALVDEINQKNRFIKTRDYHNKYKGIIFNEDTNTALCHESYNKSEKRMQFRSRIKGGGSINEDILDYCVKKTLSALIEFFDYEKYEIEKDKQEEIKQLTEIKNGKNELYRNNESKIANLNRKFVYAPNEETEKLITEEINKTTHEQEEIIQDIAQIDNQILEIINIKIDKNKEITDTNIEYFIHKYIRRIEVWRNTQTNQTLKIYIKKQYITSLWIDYTQWNYTAVGKKREINQVDVTPYRAEAKSAFFNSIMGDDFYSRLTKLRHTPMIGYNEQ